MQQKEDLVHQYDQNVRYSPTWLKKLTMILTSVLLLTVVGLGGYWVGARQQQPSPKPIWLPSATPIQKRSSSPTVAASQTNPVYNWKTYEEHGVPFTFQYPPKTEIWGSARSNLSVSYSSYPRRINGVTVTPVITFQIQILESNQNVKEFAESSLEEDESGEDRLHFSLISPVEPVNISGYAGYKYRLNKFGEREKIFLQSPDKKHIVKIYVYTGGFQYEAELQAIYNRILSSFKFLTRSGEGEPNPHQL